MKAIATLLNQQGVTMRGRPWRTQKLQDLLSDSLYMGEYYYNQFDSKKQRPKPQEEWIKISVDPIVDEPTFTRPARTRGASTGPRLAKVGEFTHSVKRIADLCGMRFGYVIDDRQKRSISLLQMHQSAG
ncbi:MULTISPECIES: recombinase family protein [Methylomonas]|uniref:Recombinase domain-containing protein n=2 Tax=Methylomonas TaxID=416 RepID=A0A126T665_9GAMM|nr:MULTISPECIES: recombinase family protein [Methylomonas]AMK77583.1 hypothetical protein JT25_014015 [Methylomonas denitrificans]OAI05162.1 hypothetical protein A1342_12180 [Methylomonas methanica]TCV84373.1 recombinase [Methylomonas methanica]